MTEQKGERGAAREGTDKAAPPGEGEGLEEASRETVEEMEKRAGTGHAGTGDIG